MLCLFDSLCRLRACVLALALAWATSLAGCGGEPTLGDVRAGRAEVTGQGVLVIAIDGLRWDHTSMGSYDRDTTPFMASLAKDGISFNDVWGATPSLVGSHLSLLSGSAPSLAQPFTSVGTSAAPGGDAEGTWFVPQGLWLLAQSFLTMGWDTAAFVDHPLIAELSGFDAGFRSFVEFGGDPSTEEHSIGVYGVGGRFVRWVNKRPLDENWFAYLHMNDLERIWTRRGGITPTRGVGQATSGWKARKSLRYTIPLGVTEPLFHVLPPSRATATGGVTMAEYELRYDRGIRALDANLARIVGHTDEFGRSDEVTVVIVGSFGTSLGENGLYLQSGLVEEEDLRVPLVIRPSAAIRKTLGWGQGASGTGPGPGTSVEALTSLLDVAPTLVDLLDLPGLERMLGLSLRDVMAGKGEGRRRRLFASSVLPAGETVVEERARWTLYHPDRAPRSLSDSWGIGGSPVERFHARPGPLASPTAGPPLGSPKYHSEAFREVLTRWESLLLRERRALHFGGSDSDKSGIGELRALQERSTFD